MRGRGGLYFHTNVRTESQSVKYNFDFVGEGEGILPLAQLPFIEALLNHSRNKFLPVTHILNLGGEGQM